jgi:hypothetical protein
VASEIDPLDPRTAAVILAAAKYWDLPAEQIAQMIIEGLLSLAFREGLDRDAERGIWLVATFDDGDEVTVPAEDLDLPPTEIILPRGD